MDLELGGRIYTISASRVPGNSIAFSLFLQSWRSQSKGVTLLMNSNGRCINAFLLRSSCVLSEPLSIHEVEALSLRLCMVLNTSFSFTNCRCASGEDPIELVNTIPRKSFMPNI